LAVLGRSGGDQRLQKIVRQKGEGKPVELPQDDEAEPDAPPDLMAVLEQALEAAQK
jgi:non-homologous end joining protein Ku